jgi:type II secretory pathway pseudopilin PulG
MKKAYSLAEVLIILGIISTTVLGASALIINSIKTTSENQLKDAVNGVQIKALEAAKSPADLTLDIPEEQLINGVNYYFSFSQNESGYFLARQTSDATTCEENSIYKVEDQQYPILGKYNVCLVIQITPRLQSEEKYFEIFSKTIFEAEGESQINILKGYRNDGFKQQ